MRSTGRAVFVALLFVGIFAALMGAQNKSSSVPKYNPSQQQVFSGFVGQVRDYECPVSGSVGTHLSLKVGGENLEVHLAPAKFLKDYGIVINPGEKIQITGMKVEFDGKPAV